MKIKYRCLRKGLKLDNGKGIVITFSKDDTYETDDKKEIALLDSCRECQREDPIKRGAL